MEPARRRWVRLEPVLEEIVGSKAEGQVVLDRVLADLRAGVYDDLP